MGGNLSSRNWYRIIPPCRKAQSTIWISRAFENNSVKLSSHLTFLNRTRTHRCVEILRFDKESANLLPESKRITLQKAESSGALVVRNVDLHEKGNALEHHTFEYENVQSEQPEAVFRRGREFWMTITLNRPYDSSKDHLNFVFLAGNILKNIAFIVLPDLILPFHSLFHYPFTQLPHILLISTLLLLWQFKYCHWCHINKLGERSVFDLHYLSHCCFQCIYVFILLPK